MAVASSSFQPSRIGLGSIRGAPRPAGRIEKLRCGASFEPGPSSTLPIRPRTVPPMTFDPFLRVFSLTSEGLSRSALEK